MRITFVLPGGGLCGGIRVVVAHANGLIARGHTVTIVCLQQPRIWRPRPLWRDFRDAAIYATRWTHDFFHEFKGRLIWTRDLRLTNSVPDADVVLATHWLTAAPVAELPDSKGTKFYFLQAYEAHMADPELVNPTWQLPLRKIVIARWLEDIARDQFGDMHVAHVPNGVDLGLFDAPPRRMHAPPAVGLMYSREPSKGVALAVEAVRYARQRVPELQLVVFGDQRPTDGPALPQDTRFIFRPPQRAIRGIYAQTDVWLCGSSSEGFGLPGLEAMACRCPVISTRCGGPEEYIDDGVNGYLVPIGDAPAMAARVVQLLSDPAGWKQMSGAAYETRERFSWDRATRQMESVLMHWPWPIDRAAHTPAPVATPGSAVSPSRGAA